MWAKDLLIHAGQCLPGEEIRRYHCVAPSFAVPDSSNAVLVQIHGQDRFGKLQFLTLIRCFRVQLLGQNAQINIVQPANRLRKSEFQLLKGQILRYPEVLKWPQSKAVLALIDVIADNP
jgi:hypothetical protein